MIPRQQYRQGWIYRQYRYFFPREITNQVAAKWENRTRLLYIAVTWHVLLFAVYKTLILPYEERQQAHKEAGIDIHDTINSPIYNLPQPSLYEYAGLTPKGTARPDQDTFIYKTTKTESGEEVVEKKSMDEHIKSMKRPFL